MKHTLNSITATLIVLCAPLAAHSAQPPEAATGADVPEGLTADDWASIRAAHEAHRHAAFATDDGFEARNPGQDWLTRFDGRGATTVPLGGGWTWGLELSGWGFEGRTGTVDRPRAVRVEGQRVSHDWDETLTEWWVNDWRGLEHGFTVHAPPPDAEGVASDALVFELTVLGGLQPEVTANRLGARFAGEDGVTVLTYDGLVAFDAQGTNLDTWMERTNKGLRLVVRAQDARYPITIDPLVQTAYLKASNTGVGDQFGWSVAVSGDTVVVGANGESSSATGVNAGAAAEADNSAGGSGAAYVFVRSGSVWSQEAYLKASNTDGGDQFGVSVGISGDTIVVGARWESSNATGVNAGAAAEADNSAPAAGAAYVFVRSGSVWSQEAYLKASNTDGEDRFGGSVAVFGDTVVVGAYRESSNATGVNAGAAAGADNSASRAGAAYVFVRSGSVWSQEAYFKASNTDSADGFGVSVGISGDTAVVGALGEDSSATGVNAGAAGEANNSVSRAGAAYVFARSGSVWSQVAYLKASNVGGEDLFGYSVAVSGDTVVVGALWEDSSATGVNAGAAAEADNSALRAGAAYVFVRVGSVWSQGAYLKASGTDSGDEFGFSVAVSGDTVVVGAWLENSGATGVNAGAAAEADNSVEYAGAAYVFVRSGSVWSQEAYLKASNSGLDDFFGMSVAVSEGTVVVGAAGEDSNATGVNAGAAGEADNSVMRAGAAYVFEVGTQDLGTNYCTAVPNSTGQIGVMAAQGSASVAGNDVTLIAAQLPSSFGFFLVSNQQAFVTTVPNSVGNLCLGGTIGRFQQQGQIFQTMNGQGSLTIDLTAIPQAGLTVPVMVGDTWNFQAWHRDIAAGGATSNFTNGLEITFH